MKKKVFFKSFWQSTLSIFILGVFIYFGFGSDFNLFPDTKKVIKNCGNGFFEETYLMEKEVGYWTEFKIINGKRNNQNQWYGEVEIQDLNDDESCKSVEVVNMVYGVRHGISKTTFTTGEIKFICYDRGKRIPCEKAAHIGMSDSSAFQILNYKYPWFLYSLNAFDFNDEYVEAYMDTLEIVMNSYEFNEEEFGGYYSDARSELEETPYYNIIKINSDLSMFQGLELAKNTEFRLAVIDRFWAGKASTYNSVSSTYPGYLQLLNVYFGVEAVDFEEFCLDFDSLLVSYGSLDQEDPFYVDSLDERMYRAIESIYSVKDSTKSAIVLLKSTGHFYINKKIGSKLNKINPKLKSSLLSANPQEVAMAVGMSVLMHYADGDILNKVANEAYMNKNGIINFPTVTTDFLSNNSASSVNINGYVIEDGGAEVTDRGIVWATYYNPTNENQLLRSGSGLGQYTVDLTGLEQGTTYYARSYAINSRGIAYGNCVSFTAGVTGAITIINPDLDLTVYPNPNKGNFTFSINSNIQEDISLKLINSMGQIIEERNILSASVNHTEQFNLSHLSKGIYYLHISSKQYQRSEKIVVQ